MAAGPKGCTGEARLAPYSHRLNSYRQMMYGRNYTGIFYTLRVLKAILRRSSSMLRIRAVIWLPSSTT